MAFRGTYFDLCHDVTRKVFSYLHLPQFQTIVDDEQTHSPGSHICTYGQRYELRYKETLKMAKNLFDDEESQYLFTAGNEYGEVGFRSHLYLSPFLCFRGAVLQGDPALYRYFRERLDLQEGHGELTHLAAQRADPELLRQMQVCGDLNERQSVRLPNLEIAKTLLDLRDPECIVFAMARDLPLGAVYPLLFGSRRFDKKQQPMLMSNLIAGLAASGDEGKVRYARKCLAEWFPKGSQTCDQSVLQMLGHAIGSLDDLSLFQELWPELKPKTPDYWIVHLAECGALQILEWLLANGEAVRAGEASRRYKGRYLRRLEAIPKVLQLFERNVEPPLLGGLMVRLYAIVGDARVLRPDIPNVLDVAEELLEHDYKDLLCEFYEQVVIPTAIVTNREALVQFVLDRHIPAQFQLYERRFVERLS